jgi:hypothetical protein
VQLSQLIKKRPQVGLLAPTLIRPGRAFEVEVVIEVERELPTEAIVVELHGTRLSGHGEHRARQRYLRQRATLGEGARLEVGEHRRRVRFEIPSGFPSSYAGVFVDVEYTVEVRVEIPWWPDKLVVFPLRVQALSEGAADDEPRVFVPSLEGAQQEEAHFELSLGTQTVEPGGTLKGAMAVANTHAKRYRGLEIDLVVTESQPSIGLHHSYRKRRWLVESDPRLAEAGATLPFHISMPKDLCPAFSAGGVSIRWSLEVRLKVAWSRDRSIRLPLTIRVSESALDPALAPVPVAVGDARATGMWKEAAQKAQWEFGPGGLLSKEIAGFAVQVSRRDEGQQRALVRVDYEDLGIDIHFKPGRGRGFGCEDETQSMYLWKELGEVFEVFEVVDVSDHHLVFAGGGAALEAAELFALLTKVEGAMPALGKVFDDLPDAALWPSHHENLVELASALSARAEAHACRVRGAYGGVPFKLRAVEGGWQLQAEVEPPFSGRESVHLAQGGPQALEARPEFGEWAGHVLSYIQTGSVLLLLLGADEELTEFPVALATRILDGLARRRSASLGGYR